MVREQAPSGKAVASHRSPKGGRVKKRIVDILVRGKAAASHRSPKGRAREEKDRGHSCLRQDSLRLQTVRFVVVEPDILPRP